MSVDGVKEMMKTFPIEFEAIKSNVHNKAK